MPEVFSPAPGFPSCVSLSLEFNPHAAYYDSMAQWLEDNDTTFVSPEERVLALQTGRLWVLHWYPQTPVGFHRLAASNLQALLDAAA